MELKDKGLETRSKRQEEEITLANAPGQKEPRTRRVQSLAECGKEGNAT